MSFKNNHPNANNVATLLKIKLFGVIETDRLSYRTEYDHKTDDYVFIIYRSYTPIYEHRTPKDRFVDCRNNEQLNAVKSEIASEMVDGIVLSLI